MKSRFLIKSIIYTILITGLITVYVFGFNFLKNKSQSIADHEASINNQINQIQQSIDNKKQSDSIAKIGESINSHFLKSSDVPNFLNSLEEIGGRTGSIINISSVDEGTSETGTTLNLYISANGSYQAIYRTLVELENLPYLSRVNNVSLSFNQNMADPFDFTKKPALQNSWSLDAQVIIKSYSK